MPESQSTACVCFIYSLVTTGLKRKKKKKKKTKKFHSNKHGLPRASLQKKKRTKRQKNM